MHIDTRDLETAREELKQQILESFLETFPHYEDMTDSFEDIRFEEEEIESWRDGWYTELEVIEAIDEVENEIGNGFNDGVCLIEEDDFADYCEELCTDVGYISRDFPGWIEIDWKATANNMKQDYSEVTYQGNTYLYRS